MWSYVLCCVIAVQLRKVEVNLEINHNLIQCIIFDPQSKNVHKCRDTRSLILKFYPKKTKAINSYPLINSIIKKYLRTFNLNLMYS